MTSQGNLIGQLSVACLALAACAQVVHPGPDADEASGPSDSSDSSEAIIVDSRARDGGDSNPVDSLGPDEADRRDDNESGDASQCPACIEPPRPVWPGSGSLLTTNRPSLGWGLPSGVRGAVLGVC